MRGLQADGIEGDESSSGAYSSAADSSDAGQYALGKETREGLEMCCLEFDGPHVNGGGFSGEEAGLYQLSTVRTEDQRLLKIFDAKHAYKMSHATKYMSNKGKTVVVARSSGLFKCEPSNHLVTVLSTAITLTTLGSAEHVETSGESSITLQETSSFSEHIVYNASVTHDKNLQRRKRDKARRDRLTPEQREEMNACRRAARQNKTDEERNASQRAARQKVTPREREEMNARRRAAANKSKTAEERQEMNARRRARRQSIPPEERQALRTQRNACLAAKRNTPCAESIAMPCPGAHLF